MIHVEHHEKNVNTSKKQLSNSEQPVQELVNVNSADRIGFVGIEDKIPRHEISLFD